MMLQKIISRLLLTILMVISAVHFSYCQQDKRPKDWAEKIETSKIKNLWKLNDSVYRSAQPDIMGFAYLKSIGVNGSLNLRSHHSDQEYLTGINITEYDVEMNANNITDDAVINALKILQSAKKPIVIHCKQGSDRTGVVVAFYRIIFQGWSKEKALKEMQEGDYGFHSKYADIPAYIKNADIEKIRKALDE